MQQLIDAEFIAEVKSTWIPTTEPPACSRCGGESYWWLSNEIHHMDDGTRRVLAFPRCKVCDACRN